MLHRSALRLAIAGGLLFPLVALAAGMFPDVGDTYPFKGEIESLARAGVINGNPDGKFNPDRSVNRAEFLKLLYTASGRKPVILSGCFTDVDRGSWYEAYVCDAASKANAFVQGYSDGRFRPASPVSRTEALKMVFTVFGLAAPEVTSADQDLIKFVDISVSAWYSRYIIAAYKNGMFPITGQSGVRFYPDRELTRGEAAAYIFNAQVAMKKAMLSSSASSSASSVAPADIIKQVTFPFKDTDKFLAKRPTSYQFRINAKGVVHVQADVIGFYPSEITCRLYLIENDGFSNEYYLGTQTANSCILNVNVRPGTYHLQLQPTVADVNFTVNASVGTGDGNDGFLDAIWLKSGTPRTGMMEPNDLGDWYSFTVEKEMDGTVEVSGTSKVDCIIYTPKEVDQYGFTGPECGKPYHFFPGDEYIIGIGRGMNDLEKTVTYTVKWQ